MDVSVIILNWNSKKWVRQCLCSLRSVPTSLRSEVIVVDNASYDGCAEMLQREFPDVIFVQNPENNGFAKGNNLGARKAAGRNLLFLNPDTELFEDSISIMASQLDSLPAAGAVGCRVLNFDRSLQTSCIQAFPSIINQLLDSNFLRRLFPRSRLWGTAAFLSERKCPEVVDAVTGACVMVKRDVFDRVGGWTEAYFMYGEDLDLSYKIHQAGYRVYYVPQTSLVHYGGTSTEQTRSSFEPLMMSESVYKFFRIHRGAFSAQCYRLAMICSSILRLLILLPVSLVGAGQTSGGPRSARKWASVLRWSLGLEVARKEQVDSSGQQ